MGDFWHRPLNWIFTAAGTLLVATVAFVVFQPVQVIPRIAYGPTYNLVDQYGEPITEASLAGNIVLFGFGYTSDPTDRLDRTMADMHAFEQAVAGADLEGSVKLGLILYDHVRDTLEKRQSFAVEQGLDANWLLIGGDPVALKQTVGQGFGIYYEAVPMIDLVENEPALAEANFTFSPDDVGYLQAERFVLIDERNIIRAEYRMPLDVEMALRDVRYIIREKNATGAGKALNEAAHLFLCYPQ
jgi:cytochrome oxidase Cu insertion factor (SCO1/SenC/PrrC family)